MLHLQMGDWIGWWTRERDLSADTLEYYLRGTYSPAEMEEAVRLLSQGYKVEEKTGPSNCIICSQLCVHFYDDYVGYGKMTNGEWVWSIDLVHLVKRHGLILPEAFRESLLKPPSRRGALFYHTLIQDCSLLVDRFARRINSPSLPLNPECAKAMELRVLERARHRLSHGDRLGFMNDGNVIAPLFTREEREIYRDVVSEWVENNVR